MSRKSTKTNTIVDKNIENDVIPEETNVINNEQSVDETTNDTTQNTSDIVSEDQTINSDESLNQQPTPIQPTNFRIIEFSNNNDNSIATIKNIITDSEGSTSKHIDDFKTKPTDIVKLYELNQEIIDSETSAIETEISSINDQISSQNTILKPYETRILYREG